MTSKLWAMNCLASSRPMPLDPPVTTAKPRSLIVAMRTLLRGVCQAPVPVMYQCGRCRVGPVPALAMHPAPGNGRRGHAHVIGALGADPDDRPGDPELRAARSSAVTQPKVQQRRKLTVLALGAVGLGCALTAAAFVAPNRGAALAKPFVPSDPAEVVATVPARDAGEVAARQALAAAPQRVELAVVLARGDLERYRALSDPRYLGRAQAILAPWWRLPQPPADVLLLRATIEQSVHQFGEARADLDHLVVARPADVQAQLTRAVVATITADYAAARASCRAVAQLATPLVAAACEAPLDAVAGKAGEAQARLAKLLLATRDPEPAVRGWVLTELAE